jgi:RepB DNA-primase from phage plasmid
MAMQRFDPQKMVANLPVCLEHCEWISLRQGQGLFAIRVLADSPDGGKTVRATRFFDNRSQHFRDEVALFLRRNVQPSAHVFYSVSGFLEPRALAKLATPGRLLHVDADAVALPPRGPRPSRIVESSPGNYHFLYVIDQVVGREKREALSKALQQLVGGDAGGQSAGKLLRLPGTYNAKHALAVVRVVESSETVYSVDHIQSFLPPSPLKHGATGVGQGAVSGNHRLGRLDKFSRLRLKQSHLIQPFALHISGSSYLYPGDNRSDVIFHIALDLARANWPREEIANTLAETVFWRSREKEGKAEDIDRLIDKVLESAEELRGSQEK